MLWAVIQSEKREENGGLHNAISFINLREKQSDQTAPISDAVYDTVQEMGAVHFVRGCLFMLIHIPNMHINSIFGNAKVIGNGNDRIL